MSQIIRAINSYDEARAAKVGSVIRCPWCQKTITKTAYNKTFCSNGRSKRGKNCKDEFWNSVDPTRRERARHYF